MEQLIDFFRQKAIRQVLDIGTGTGDFISILKETFPEANIFGVDPNTESLESARKNYPDVFFSEMTADKLDFPDFSFDVASISMALHHLPDVQKSLHEMQRIVKPNGWIIVNELFSDNLSPAQEVHKMFHHFKSKVDRILGISHNNTFTKEEVVKMVKNSGIKILLHFEYNSLAEPVKNPEEINEKIKKMEVHLEQIKDYPEYKNLIPQIDKFKERSSMYGIQIPTKIMIIGKACDVNKD